VTLPQGFLGASADAGIRKKRAPDVALIVAESGANAAAVFTRNRFQAAPVQIAKRSLTKSGGRVRAVVVNAGCANAITGRAGHDAARRVQRRAAELLGCRPEEVFPASTGVIGVVLPDEKLSAALPEAIAALSPDGLEAVSRAILTTDSGPKVAEATFLFGGVTRRLSGFCKGAGMIHPDMATMLAFLLTDAALTPAALKTALREAVDVSFNAISVDGDTSTNDTVLLLSSGKGKRAPSKADSNSFRVALQGVCKALARMIARDGEGATRLMALEVRGARSRRDARLAANAIATSPLVKTALFGGDPNWGRILAALGRSGARFSPAKVSLRVGPLTLVADGEPVPYEERDAAAVFAQEEVPIVVDLGEGGESATVLASDLSHGYVTLNADYRS